MIFKGEHHVYETPQLLGNAIESLACRIYIRQENFILLVFYGYYRHSADQSFVGAAEGMLSRMGRLCLFAS